MAKGDKKKPQVCGVAVIVKDNFGRAVNGLSVMISGLPAKLTNGDGYAYFYPIMKGKKQWVTVLGNGKGLYSGDYVFNQDNQDVHIQVPASGIANPLGILSISGFQYFSSGEPQVPVGATAIPLIRIYNSDRLRYERAMTAFQRANFQVIRCALYLGKYADDQSNPEAGNDIFAGREVTRQLSLRLAPEILRDFQLRGMGFHGFGDGDKWIQFSEILGFIRAVSETIHANGLDAVWKYYEVYNEYFQLTQYGDSQDTVERARALMNIVRGILSPCPLFAIGSLNDEAPGALQRSSQYGDVCDLHPTSEPPEKAIKRAQNLWRERPATGLNKPIWISEPPGIGEGSSHSINDPDLLFGALVSYKMGGFALNYFNGPSVKMWDEIDSTPLFYTIVKLLRKVPENISSWYVGPGGGIWLTDGKQFCTLDINIPDWGKGYQTGPVGRWEIITYDGNVEIGNGGQIPNFGTSPYKCRLIVGEYAS